MFTADVIDEATLERVIALDVPVNAGSADMLEQLGRKKPGHGAHDHRRAEHGGLQEAHGKRLGDDAAARGEQESPGVGDAVPRQDPRRAPHGGQGAGLQQHDAENGGPTGPQGAHGGDLATAIERGAVHGDDEVEQHDDGGDGEYGAQDVLDHVQEVEDAQEHGAGEDALGARPDVELSMERGQVGQAVGPHEDRGRRPVGAQRERSKGATQPVRRLRLGRPRL